MPHRVDFPPDYQHEWSTDQQEFIMWCALPTSLRPEDEGSQKAWAKKHGLHGNTLTMWKRIPGFTDRVWEIGLAYLGGDVGEILRALSRKARAEDVPAIKLALEVLKKYEPGATIEVGPVLVFGADVMRDVSQAVADYERKRLVDAKRDGEAGGGEEGA